MFPKIVRFNYPETETSTILLKLISRTASKKKRTKTKPRAILILTWKFVEWHRDTACFQDGLRIRIGCASAHGIKTAAARLVIAVALPGMCQYRPEEQKHDCKEGPY